MCPKMRPVGVSKTGKKGQKLSCVKLAICPDHPRRGRPLKVCMRGRVREVVIHFKFHQNRSRGLDRAVEGRKSPSHIDLGWPMAYATACTTAVMLHLLDCLALLTQLLYSLVNILCKWCYWVQFCINMFPCHLSPIDQSSRLWVLFPVYLLLCVCQFFDKEAAWLLALRVWRTYRVFFYFFTMANEQWSRDSNNNNNNNNGIDRSIVIVCGCQKDRRTCKQAIIFQNY